MVTPIGGRINIKLLTYTVYEKMLNIDMFMAPKDVSSSQGLCGYLDNDISNDLLHADGTIASFLPTSLQNTYDVVAFSDSWRYVFWIKRFYILIALSNCIFCVYVMYHLNVYTYGDVSDCQCRIPLHQFDSCDWYIHHSACPYIKGGLSLKNTYSTVLHSHKILMK